MTHEELSRMVSGDIVKTKYNDFILIEHVDVGVGSKPAVMVYYYFAYNEKDGFDKNEWLFGFYGPSFSEDFYIIPSNQEKQLFMKKLEEYGYVMKGESYGKMVPVSNKLHVMLVDDDATKFDIELKEELEDLGYSEPLTEARLSYIDCERIAKHFYEEGKKDGAKLAGTEEAVVKLYNGTST